MTTFPHVTLTATALLGVVFLLLTFAVARVRVASRVSLGDGLGERGVAMGDEPHAPKLLIAIRAHANFAEYVPFSLLLLLLLELAGAPRYALLTLAAMLITGRVLHPFGLAKPARNVYRAGGILLQWAMLLLGTAYALVLAVALAPASA